MNFKKHLSKLLMLTVVASMTLAGCGGGGGGAATGGDSGAATGGDSGAATGGDSGAAATSGDSGGSTGAAVNKIIVFQSKVEIIDQLEALAKEYKAETGVEVEVWNTPGDDYNQSVKSRLANNQGPTVFSLGYGVEVNQLENYLADLKDLSFVKDVFDGMTYDVNGKVLGIPYTIEGFGMVYNKSLINPADVTNYDSFVKMLQDQKANGVNGFGLSQEGYFLIGHILNAPFAQQSDVEGYINKLTAGEVKMADTPEFQEFAKFYAAIRDYSYNPLEVRYDREIGDFATSKTASIHQGNWANGMFVDYDMNFEFGMMPFPLAGNDKLAVGVPSVWVVNSQKSPEEVQAGKDFINWLYTSATGTRYLMDEFQFLPVVQGMENSNMDPLSADVVKYASEGKTVSWATNYYPGGMVDVHLVPVAQKFFTTSMTPEEFLTALDEAWQAGTR